jgi:hypothetical protein
MRRILIATIGAAVLSVLFALPAAAGPGTAFATVDPTSGAPGEPITVSGNCGVAQSGIDVDIKFVQGNPIAQLGNPQTQADGSFSLDANVPANAQVGPATIVVTCILETSEPIVLDFTVTAPAPPLAPQQPPPTAAEPVTATPAFTG